MSKLNWFLVATSLALISGTSFGAGNTASESVSSIVSRDSGYHAIFTSVSSTTHNILLAEGCTLADRTILLESAPAGKAEFAMLLSALLMNKSVVLRVDGCTAIDPDQPTTTAPKLIKVGLSK